MSRLLLVALLAVSGPAFACGSYGPMLLTVESDDGAHVATLLGDAVAVDGDPVDHDLDLVTTVRFSGQQVVLVGLRDGRRAVTRVSIAG